MDFREYAAKETSDLVARLTKASAEAVDEASKRVASDAQKAADALRTELQAAVKQKMAAVAAQKEAQTQAEALRGDLKTAAERAEVVSRQLADARKANEKLEAAQSELTAARDQLAKARAAAEAELHRTKEALDSSRAELTLAGKKLEQALADRSSLEEAASAAHSASQASEAKLLAVTDLFKQSGARVKALERTLQDYERTIKDLGAREAQPQAAPVAGPAVLPVLDDLLAGFQALSGASTIADVLTTLVEHLAAQYPRVALFRVKKSHLQGEHQIGFDLSTDIAKVVMPLGMDSLPSRAASSGRIERLSGAELKQSRAPFAGTPTSALALPVMVNGEPLAIVYADDAGAAGGSGGAGASELNARVAEAMQQHASALLARLANELKALAELQAYAASLLRELEQMHAADLQAGISGKELQDRLEANLEYARSIYGSRIALEGADAAALLEDELTVLIDERPGTPFGVDLARVAGRLDPGRSAAEAS